MATLTHTTSVVICTYNRGDSVVATLQSVLANTHPHFEVILVDQSSNTLTSQAVHQFLGDPRFKYIHTPTPGKGNALNLGLAQAQGQIVAFTDDDCTVPAHWLQAIQRVFEQQRHVAIMFCNVAPAPHDPTAGLIPHYLRQGNHTLRALGDRRHARGMGAGMAARRAEVLALGGFDRSIGPGSPFRSGDDLDIALRALAKKMWVYETSEVVVTHHGFRTRYQWKDLTRRYWFGIGAVYAKFLKCGYWQIVPVIAYEAVVIAVGQPLGHLLRFNRPRGLLRLPMFLYGLYRGLCTPVDRDRIMFQAGG